MRTHRTVYRVLREDGTEAYRGKRSAVIRFLGAKGRGATSYIVQRGRYDPAVEQGPSVWEASEPLRTRKNG